MRKIIILLVLLCFFCVSIFADSYTITEPYSSSSYSSSSYYYDEYPDTVSSKDSFLITYLGLTMQQFNFSGLPEGQVTNNFNITMDDKNVLALGGVLGVRNILTESAQGLLELNVYIGNESKDVCVNACLGGVYYLLDGWFRLGAGIKVGYFVYGKTLNRKGYSSSSTDMDYMLNGVFASPFVEMRCEFDSSFGCGVNAGYQLGFGTSNYLQYKGEKTKIGGSPIYGGFATQFYFDYRF